MIQNNYLPNLQLKRLPQTLILLMLSILAGNSAFSYGLGPQDFTARRDLQALIDSGKLNAITNTWPLPWRTLTEQLSQLEHSDLPPYLIQAKLRLEQQAKRFTQPTPPQANTLSLQTHSQPHLISHFGSNPHAENSAQASFAWSQTYFSGQLSINAVESDIDHQHYQLDDSYIAAHLGNWVFGLGTIDQWWGPGWQSSLILSHNARPIPGVFITRNSQAPFTSPLLQWLGPWHLVSFMGQLESDRTISDALLWGMRLSFAPSQHWEIGLSRSAQWGGKNRPKSFDTFWDLLIGEDNFESSDPGKATEPGNQLGGIDIRFHAQAGQGSYALYTQWIGEDEAGGLPSRPMGLIGMSVTVPLHKAPMTTILEYQDTALDSYKSNEIFNSGYNHSIYTTGYRHRGRVIGSSFDNDTRALTWAALFNTSPSWAWSLWLTHLDANRDGAAANNTVSQQAQTLSIINLLGHYQHATHTLTVGANWHEELTNNLLSRDKKAGISIGYEYNFKNK